MGAIAQKVITNNAGQLQEVASISTSAGAADAGKIIATNASGQIDGSFLNATVSSSPNKLVMTGGDGKIDVSVLPTGVGADTAVINASEALAAGDLVNIWNDSGTANVRKADASTAGKEAHGFVLAAVASGQPATVYFEGTNTQMTGLTPGRQYLSTTPGKTSATAPTGSGQVVQVVGFAVSATAMNFQSNPPIVLV